MSTKSLKSKRYKIKNDLYEHYDTNSVMLFEIIRIVWSRNNGTTL